METNKSNKFLIKSKKQMFAVIAVFTLLLFVGGTTYAFFNYTRTGDANTITVGRISFNTTQASGQDGAINLSNAFPITRAMAATDTTNTGEVVITITGDTTYNNGIEYLVTATDVTNTVSSKTVPISIIATASSGLGTEDEEYFDNRGSSAANSIYKVLANETISNNDQLLVGYIKNGATGVNGTLTIKAYIDSDKVVISDTYNNGNTPTDNLGTPVSFGEGKTVLTTSEWNSLRTNGISFKVKVEARENTWVEEPPKNLANHIISRLGNDGVVAINTSGALASTGDTIREYRYSGGGRYCEYENNGTTYKFQIEENTCPETVVFGGGPPGLYSPTADIAAYQGGTAPTGTTYTLKTGTGVQEGTVKNYISFNGEMWRIIGVFDGKVKIMKDLPIKTDDSYVVNSYTALNNTTYTIKPSGLSGSMATTKYAPIQWNSDLLNTKNNWAQAGLQYWLNENNTGSYYNTIGSTYKNLIADETYYLSNVNTSSWGTASSVYNDERATAVECASSVTSNSQSNSCNVWSGNSATWDGKIALPYPSDFGYAANSSYYGTSIGSYYNSSDPTIQGENWFSNNDAYYNWFLSPSSQNPQNVAYWSGPGYVNDYNPSATYVVRPVLSISASTLTTGGDGSYANPYTLKVS